MSENEPDRPAPETPADSDEGTADPLGPLWGEGEEKDDGEGTEMLWGDGGSTSEAEAAE